MPTVGLLRVKLLFNSVAFTPGAALITVDIKYVYFNTLMDRFEYTKLKLSNLLEGFFESYKSEPKSDKHIQAYVEVRKGMYRLLQAGLLIQQLLEERLNTKVYSQSTLVPGLWTHT